MMLAIHHTIIIYLTMVLPFTETLAQDKQNYTDGR
jgi:hypothetical protein